MGHQSVADQVGFKHLPRPASMTHGSSRKTFCGAQYIVPARNAPACCL